MSWQRARQLSLMGALPTLILVIWQVAAATQPIRRGFPVPSRVIISAQQLITSGDLQLGVWVSLQRVLVALLIAALAGITLGLLMGYFRAVEHNVDPIVQTFRMVAPIALVPLAVIWFGTGDRAPIFIVAYGTFFPIVISTIAGVKQVDRLYVRAAQTMGLGRLAIMYRVVLPGALPSIFVGVRLALGMAWGAIVAAELTVGARALTTAALGSQSTGAQGGIGFMMFFLYDNRVDMNAIVVAMITVGIVALAMDRCLRVFQGWVMPWAAR